MTPMKNSGWMKYALSIMGVLLVSALSVILTMSLGQTDTIADSVIAVGEDLKVAVKDLDTCEAQTLVNTTNIAHIKDDLTEIKTLLRELNRKIDDLE